MTEETDKQILNELRELTSLIRKSNRLNEIGMKVARGAIFVLMATYFAVNGYQKMYAFTAYQNL